MIKNYIAKKKITFKVVTAVQAHERENIKMNLYIIIPSMFFLLEDRAKLFISFDTEAVKLSYTNLMCLYIAVPIIRAKTVQEIYFTS